MRYWVFAVIVSSGVISAAVSTEFQPRERLTYDDFVKLPDDRPDSAYAQFSAEDKAAIMRTRLERWLEEHRTDLSARQTSTVRKQLTS